RRGIPLQRRPERRRWIRTGTPLTRTRTGSAYRLTNQPYGISPTSLCRVLFVSQETLADLPAGSAQNAHARICIWRLCIPHNRETGSSEGHGPQFAGGMSQDRAGGKHRLSRAAESFFALADSPHRIRPSSETTTAESFGFRDRRRFAAELDRRDH